MRKFKFILQVMLITALVSSMLPVVLAADTDNLSVNYGDSNELGVKMIGRYTSGAELDEGGTEIIAYDPNHHRMYSINGFEESLDIVDLSNLKSGDAIQDIELTKRIKLGDFHSSLQQISDITSVAIHPTDSYLAIAVPADPKQDPGYVVFTDLEGTYLNHVTVGALPDMLTFTPDGTKLLVANEGEPDDEYLNNPEGSVAIINLSSGPSNLTEEQVAIVSFNNEVVGDDIRRVNSSFTKAQDMEPEYIVVSSDSKTAYVVLQENNSIATLDIEDQVFTSVNSLGYKDWSMNNNQMDASNKDDKINIQNWPVLSMYMPDGLSLYEADGKQYLITPNEGDAADYDGFSEEARVADMTDNYALNADLFAGYTQEQLDQMVADGLFDEDQLGRLNTTTSAPQNGSKYEAVYGYGARSFTIWDAADLSLVYDSGSDFENITAKAIPDYFNTDNAENKLDNRSDDKGPEPESVITGALGEQLYAFVGLERSGGIMIYNVTNVMEPTFVKYFSSRDFSVDDEVSGDSAPEGLQFVQASDSPTGKALLLAAHEVTGTVAVYELSPKQTTELEPSGDEYTMFADNPMTGHFAGLDEAVITYLQEEDEVAAAVEGRITEGSIQGTTTVTADSSYVVKSGDSLYRIG